MKIWFGIGAKQGGPQPLENYLQPKLRGFFRVAAQLLPGSGRKVEVTENKRLSPFYPGPRPPAVI
jgi:hypothetical protein